MLKGFKKLGFKEKKKCELSSGVNDLLLTRSVPPDPPPPPHPLLIQEVVKSILSNFSVETDLPSILNCRLIAPLWNELVCPKLQAGCRASVYGQEALGEYMKDLRRPSSVLLPLPRVKLEIAKLRHVKNGRKLVADLIRFLKEYGGPLSSLEVLIWLDPGQLNGRDAIPPFDLPFNKGGRMSPSWDLGNLRVLAMENNEQGFSLFKNFLRLTAAVLESCPNLLAFSFKEHYTYYGSDMEGVRRRSNGLVKKRDVVQDLKERIFKAIPNSLEFLRLDCLELKADHLSVLGRKGLRLKKLTLLTSFFSYDGAGRDDGIREGIRILVHSYKKTLESLHLSLPLVTAQMGIIPKEPFPRLTKLVLNTLNSDHFFEYLPFWPRLEAIEVQPFAHDDRYFNSEASLTDACLSVSVKYLILYTPFPKIVDLFLKSCPNITKLTFHLEPYFPSGPSLALVFKGLTKLEDLRLVFVAVEEGGIKEPQERLESILGGYDAHVVVQHGCKDSGCVELPPPNHPSIINLKCLKSLTLACGPGRRNIVLDKFFVLHILPKLEELRRVTITSTRISVEALLMLQKSREVRVKLLKEDQVGVHFMSEDPWQRV